jgi:hypothetical protein
MAGYSSSPVDTGPFWPTTGGVRRLLGTIVLTNPAALHCFGLSPNKRRTELAVGQGKDGRYKACDAGRLCHFCQASICPWSGVARRSKMLGPFASVPRSLLLHGRDETNPNHLQTPHRSQRNSPLWLPTQATLWPVSQDGPFTIGAQRDQRPMAATYSMSSVPWRPSSVICTWLSS